MIDVAKLEAIARDLRKLLPEGGEQLHQSIRKNIRLITESVLERMDLVTREEFDTQQALLIRTRERLEALERKLAELERTTPP